MAPEMTQWRLVPALTRLREWSAWWLTIQTDDPVRQVLGRGLIGVLAVLLLFDLLLLVVNLQRGALLLAGVNVVLDVLLMLAALSTRNGQRWGILLLGGTIMLANTFVSPLATYIPLQVVPLPLIGGVVLITMFDTPRSGVIAYAIQMLLMAVAILAAGQPAGSWVWLATSAILLGGMLGFVAIGAQLFRRAIVQFARLTQDLEQRVAARTAELARANTELAQANDDKAVLMAARQHAILDVVHDARGFVQAIQAGMELARMDVAPALAQIPDVGASLESVERAVGRLTAMLKDLRDAALLEEQTLTLNPRQVDLVRCAQDLVLAFQPTFQMHGLRLTYDGPGTPQLGWCDPDRVTRVVANFVTNALRYTSSFRSEDDGAVQVLVRAVPGWVIIGVRDNGPGMGQAELERLGQRFVRFSAGQAVPEGLGIGLNLSIGLIRASGGHIQVITAPGEGVRIWSALPVTAGQAADTLSWPDHPPELLSITL